MNAAEEWRQHRLRVGAGPGGAGCGAALSPRLAAHQETAPGSPSEGAWRLCPGGTKERVVEFCLLHCSAFFDAPERGRTWPKVTQSVSRGGLEPPVSLPLSTGCLSVSKSKCRSWCVR